MGRIVDNENEIVKATTTFRALVAEIPTSSGAFVMGTGIVSVALHLDGHETGADILAIVAAASWVVLGLLAGWRAVREPDRFARDARAPSALTAVAATSVLGSRAVELRWTAVAVCLLISAALMWVALTPSWRLLRRRVNGSAFLYVVAPQALSTLCSELAGGASARWLLIPAGGFAAVALLLYPSVLARFDRGTLRSGEGEHWVAGGSLAISAFAVAQLGLQAGEVLRVCSLIVWVAAILWLPILLVAELRWPRPRYYGQRWSTVFPLGMYAASSFAVAAAARSAGIADFGRAWVWIALGGWFAATAGMVVDFQFSHSSHRRPFPSKED